MRKPRTGAIPMSATERQARRRTRVRRQRPASPAAPTRRLAPRPGTLGRRSRGLGPLAREDRAWLDNRPANLKARRWPTSYRQLPNSTSRSWRQSIHHVVAAATDSLLTAKAPYKPDPKAYVRRIIDNHRPLSEPTTAAQPCGGNWSSSSKAAFARRRREFAGSAVSGLS